LVEPTITSATATAVSILIVDDRPENLLALKSLLESQDVTVLTAASGNEALGMVLDHDFALVLMDVQMPGMDGFETAELMRGAERSKHIPIIFVTAISKEQKYVFRGYESGAVDYLFKPIEPEILKSKVKVFLELYRQKKLIEEQASTLDIKITELLETKKQLEDAYRKMESLSALDGLTAIPNRRRFDEFFTKEWLRAKRNKESLSVIMIDIDFFKAYNDSLGHQAGDECLKKVARALTASLNRPSDLVARYGGEEFVAVLTGTDANGARTVGETMRRQIEALAIRHPASEVSPYVTVSVGTSTSSPRLKIRPSDLLDAADRTMYQAKQEGRNRVVSLAP